MVLELSVMCLRSICDGLESGRIRGPHLGAIIPPNSTTRLLSPISLRQRLLDLALVRGSMGNNPNCIAAFSSTEFLDGMSSLDTTINIDKSDYRLTQYARELAVSLDTASRINSDVTIGSRFGRLKLWVDESNLEPIGWIVTNCPNLRALKLSIVTYGTNENANHSARLLAQNHVISNLDELSIDYYGMTRQPQSIIGTFLADVRFSSLRTFCIRGKYFPAKIESQDWMGFLQNVRSTLTSLEVDHLRLSIYMDEQLFQFPLDRLQCLRIGSYPHFRWSPEILAQCGEMAYLDVPLYGSTSTEEARAIQQLGVNLAMNLSLDSSDTDLLVPDQTRFRLVDIFGQNVTSFGYRVDENWNEQHMIALVDVFSACPNLINFEFVASPAFVPALIDLSPLFDNVSHRYLKEISIFGNFKVGKLFEKYVDLDSLSVAFTQLIRDEDLIAWTRRGGGRRLSRLQIANCAGLTYNGIVALFIAWIDVGKIQFLQRKRR